MSTKGYQFSGSVDDGDTPSPDMSYTHERGYVAFEFYSDAALTNLVTPTAGTITTTVSELGAIFGSISSGVTDASLVGPGVRYNRPNWAGSARTLRVSMLGIAGANFFKCNVYRYGS